MKFNKTPKKFRYLTGFLQNEKPHILAFWEDLYPDFFLNIYQNIDVELYKIITI